MNLQDLFFSFFKRIDSSSKLNAVGTQDLKATSFYLNKNCLTLPLLLYSEPCWFLLVEGFYATSFCAPSNFHLSHTPLIMLLLQVSLNNAINGAQEHCNLAMLQCDLGL